MTIGDRIAECRRALGYTQSRLAREASMAQSTVNMYESGQRMPSVASLATLARALGVATADLIEEPGEPLGDAQLVQAYAALSPARRVTLLDFALFLVGQE